MLFKNALKIILSSRRIFQNCKTRSDSKSQLAASYDNNSTPRQLSFHNTACFTHTATPKHTLARTHTRTEWHTQGLCSPPPHSNLPPVTGVSRLPLAVIGTRCTTKSFHRSAFFCSGFFLLLPLDSAWLGELHMSPKVHQISPARQRPSPPVGSPGSGFLAAPVPGRLRSPQPAPRGRHCSPAEPCHRRCCLSGAPLSPFGEPCNKKSRLRRHTMWKGGRFKKEKNASKNNKSQL